MLPANIVAYHGARHVTPRREAPIATLTPKSDTASVHAELRPAVDLATRRPRQIPLANA